MVVNNTTHLSGDTIHDVLIKSSKKNIFSRSIYIFVVGLCGILILIIGLFMKNTSFELMGGLFTAFSLMYLLFNLYNYKKSKKKIMSENKELIEHGIDYTFVFKEQSIKIEAIEPNKRVKKEYKYDDIKKIFEFEEYFEMIFFDTLIAYVSKEGFENDKMIEFFKKNISINKKKIVSKIKVNK